MTHAKAPLLRRSSTAFLQVVIVFVGLGALALLLWEPHLEGRNKNATAFQIYFNDPFLAYVYFASIPFFVALYQAFKVLGYAGRNDVFSQAAVNALRTIKWCAIAIIGFVAGAAIIIMSHGEEDGAGAVAMCIFVAFGAVVVATAAATFQRVLQSAVDVKAENDLTV